MNKLYDLLYLYNNGHNPFPHLNGGLGYKPRYVIEGGTLTMKEKQQILKTHGRKRGEQIIKEQEDTTEPEETTEEWTEEEIDKLLDEVKKDEEDRALITSVFDTWRRNQLKLEPDSGYNYFKNEKTQWNKKGPNGEVFEEFNIINPDVHVPVKAHMDDTTLIESNDDKLQKILNPNEETNTWWQIEQLKSDTLNVIGILTDKINNTNDITKKEELEEERNDYKDLNKQIVNATNKSSINDMKEIINKYKIPMEMEVVKYTNGRNKTFYLAPWETAPVDNSSENVEYEIKNYIKTGANEGVTINNTAYNFIQRMRDKGMTTEQIEQYFKDNNMKIPTVPITVSKLTGIKKQTTSGPKFYTDVRYEYGQDSEGNIYPESLIYKGLKPNKDNKLVQYNDYLTDLTEGGTKKKKLVYDMLTNNARVFYEPLKDTNAKYKDGSVSLPYKTKLKGNTLDYLVPITRVTIEKPNKYNINSTESLTNTQLNRLKKYTKYAQINK